MPLTIPVTHKLPLDLNIARYEPRAFQTEFQITITPDDVARWTRIHGDDSPWCREASPWGGPIAPPYILYYVSQNVLAACPELPPAGPPPPGGGGGLARYQAEFIQPLPIGKPLRVTAEITERYLRRGRGYLEWETTAWDGGTPLQRHTKTWVLSVPDALKDSIPERPSEPRGRDEPPALETFGPLALPITNQQLEDFEGPGHPNDTTHTNIALARAAGFPNVRAQGGIPFGILSRLMTDQFGTRYVAGGGLDVRLLQAIYAGETMVCRGEVTGREGGIVRCRVRAENPRGDVIAAGTASALEAA